MMDICPERIAPVIYRAELSSTNSELKAMARAGAPEGLVLIAGSQSDGRGRLGRSFVSPEGGLYFSMLLRPRTPDKAANVSACAAVALCRAIESCCALSPEIKWPNDLLLCGKKVCGILCESSTDTRGRFFVVLGIGINVNSDAFPDELSGIALSLSAAAGREFSLEELARACIEELDDMYPDCLVRPEVWLKEYRRRCCILGRDIFLHKEGAPVPARAIDIDRDFSLIVSVEGTQRSIAFGEISIRPRNRQDG